MEPARRSGWRRFLHGATVIGAGLALAFAHFLILPVLRAMTAPAKSDVVLREVSTELPPPPPPEPEQEEPDEQEEPPPPDVAPEAPPLDLSQLEMALNPGFGLGGGIGDFALPVGALGGAGGAGGDELFDFSDLEEKPRVVFRARPQVTRAMKKRMPCTVYVLCTVNEQGRVENPTVHSSDDPMFDGPALQAIKQWKFEPGKRNGKPSSFRVRQPITFK